MSRLHRSLAVPLFAASLLLVGACSSSTSSGAKTTAKTGANDTTPTTVKPSQSVKPGGKVHLSGSFCDKVKELQTAGVANQSGPQSTDPKAMLKYLQDTFKTGYDAIKQIKGSAPSELKPDMDYLVNAYTEANTQIQALTTYDAASMTKITGLFSSPEAKIHSDKLDAYAKNKCGIDLNGGSSGSSVTTG